RRAAALRPELPRRRGPAVDDDDHLSVQAGLDAAEFRACGRCRLAALRRHRRDRAHQPCDHAKDRHQRRTDGMSVLSAFNRRRAEARIEQRPGGLVYGFLAFVLVASVFPFYWSFLIGSGDAGTLSDTSMSWIPGGNFIANARSVMGNESINFWKALGNSVIVSTVVSASVVFFATLAGFAFAKGRFTGQKALPVSLASLQANYFVDYSIVLAGVLLATVPLLILFIFAGKQLVEGIMRGAVKG